MRATVAWLGLATVLAWGCAERGGSVGEPADLILAGGRVWTGGARPDAVVTAVAVRDGRILAVGSDPAIERLAGTETRRIALDGRLLVPGFMDNHTHFIEGGFELSGVQLRDAETPGDFARRIGDFAAEHPGRWVTGGQWDHERWGGELPRRDWVDSLTRGTPVFVTRLDGHMGLANSKALELAGIGPDTPDPAGGEIVRDADGRPTGILKDQAMSLVFAAMPERSEDEMDRALEAATRHALEQGVTFVTDMGSWAGLEAYRRARDRGTLELRVYAVVPMATRDRLAEFVAARGHGDERLRWGGVKAFVDGSLGSATAWFHEPYEDAPGETGLVVTDTTRLASDITAADAAGLHVIVHAIGTRANDWLLDRFAAAREANGPRDRRFRIEHAQHLTREAIARFGREGVIASMQPYHAIDDGRWAEKRIGALRARTTYAFRSLLDAGATVTFGSDWTVAPLDPIAGIYAAVTRRTLDGARPGGWVPEEKIGVAEALRAYTEANARASYLETSVGRIAPDFVADLAVVSDDLFAMPPESIRDARVDITLVEGEVVYEREER